MAQCLGLALLKLQVFGGFFPGAVSTGITFNFPGERGLEALKRKKLNSTGNF